MQKIHVLVLGLQEMLAQTSVQALWVQVMTPGATTPPQLPALPITHPHTRVPPLGAHA